MNYAKQIIIILISICSFQFISAQNNYVTHTLKQGESLSMLAEQYHTSVGDIMRMNGMHADTKLVYGSQIKIPSTKAQTNTVKKESSKPVANTKAATPSNEITHIVAKGETLYSISKKYNISIDQIKAWNNLADENVKLGTLLIISENASNKIATKPVQKQAVETVTVNQQNTNPVTDNSQITEAKTDAVAATKKDEDATSQPVLQTKDNGTDAATNQINIDYSGAGYFASQFKERKNKNMQSVSGVSKTFKTASGWTDGKYYILANDITPGTIVKLTADNGSAVYAKVLWNMGDLKENKGVDFRVSNATAAALKENDDSSFNVSVSF
jgi:LysM repeat protein